MIAPNSLKHFLVVIKDYSVVAYAANFKSFYGELIKIKEIKEHLPSESTIKRKLTKEKLIVYLGTDNKIYTLQKVV